MENEGDQGALARVLNGQSEQASDKYFFVCHGTFHADRLTISIARLCRTFSFTRFRHPLQNMVFQGYLAGSPSGQLAVALTGQAVALPKVSERKTHLLGQGQGWEKQTKRSQASYKGCCHIQKGINMQHGTLVVVRPHSHSNIFFLAMVHFCVKLNTEGFKNYKIENGRQFGLFRVDACTSWSFAHKVVSGQRFCMDGIAAFLCFAEACP